MRRRRRRAHEPVHVSKTIESQLDRLGVDPPLPLALVRAWAEAVGPLIASRSRPARVHGDTLIVNVSTNAWMTELQMLMPSILSRLVELCPTPKIGRLRFKLGGVPSPAGDAPDPAAWSSPSPDRVVEIPERLSAALESIEDGDLRTALEGAVRASLSRRDEQ